MNIINVVLLFYLLIGSNYIGDLYSGQMRDLIRSNIYIKHIIAFSIIIVMTKYIMNLNEPYKLLLYSLAAYLLFIISTKLDVIWNILIIMLLLIYFLIENKYNGITDNLQIDQAITDNDKETLKNNMITTKRILIYAIIACIIIGGMFYLDKKTDKFNENFDAAKYIFYPRQNEI